MAVGAGDDEEDAPRQAAPTGLSLRQEVGQLLISSFDGPSLPAYLRRRLHAGESAGVILFRENAGGAPAGLRRLTRSIQRAARGGALVMTDQEGGGFRSVPFAGPIPAQGAVATPGDAGSLAQKSGRRLRSLGVNVNLAPVADLPGGRALGDRVFRGTPDQVAAKVRAGVRGYAHAGIGAAAKHFPGLGAAQVNTDYGPVSVPFRKNALVPFRAATAAGVPLVMTSHALYPSLDKGRIASQSERISNDLLRRRLRFGGAVITDSIEAKAVVGRSGVGIAAERSVAAGADIVLMTGSASWKIVFPRLLRAARRSDRFRARVEQSAARVLELKRRLGLRLAR